MNTTELIDYIGNNWNTTSKEKGDAFLELAVKNKDNLELFKTYIFQAIYQYEQESMIPEKK